MRVLIACEFSGVVRNAFRELGHEAYSCDIIESEDRSEFHIVDDAINLAYNFHWDLMIAHPPCTHLSVSGARWFKEKIASGKQQKAIDFFIKLANAPIEKIALENPISIMSTHYRKPDQIIQPWQHGHGETKSTCLWLKNLPLIKPTCVVEGRKNTIHFAPDSKGRAIKRSRTYDGIGKAFAQQWGETNEDYI